jgi:hypothetical protein
MEIKINKNILIVLFFYIPLQSQSKNGFAFINTTLCFFSIKNLTLSSKNEVRLIMLAYLLANPLAGLRAQTTPPVSLDLAALPAGLYLVTTQINGQTNVQKIVITH